MSLLDRYTEWMHKKFDLGKPSAATWEDWEEWHVIAKKKSPVGYWLVETLPDAVEDIWRYIKKPFTETRWWIRYRLFDRYHVIKTGLKPGYQDFDARCLHGMFSLLVEYVEVELAWKASIFDTEKKGKYPWFSRGIFRFKSTPKPENGINHLKWESTLDSDSLPIHERSDWQAEKAREVLDLYFWWKYVRPQRADPMDLSGWSAICNERKAQGISILSNKKKTIEQKRLEADAIDRSNEIESAYDDEDTQQLIRLMKIRKGLWT